MKAIPLLATITFLSMLGCTNFKYCTSAEKKYYLLKRHDFLNSIEADSTINGQRFNVKAIHCLGDTVYEIKVSTGSSDYIVFTINKKAEIIDKHFELPNVF